MSGTGGTPHPTRHPADDTVGSDRDLERAWRIPTVTVVVPHRRDDCVSTNSTLHVDANGYRVGGPAHHVSGWDSTGTAT